MQIPVGVGDGRRHISVWFHPVPSCSIPRKRCTAKALKTRCCDLQLAGHGHIGFPSRVDEAWMNNDKHTLWMPVRFLKVLATLGMQGWGAALQIVEVGNDTLPPIFDNLM